jgi:hypothetical protein
MHAKQVLLRVQLKAESNLVPIKPVEKHQSALTEMKGLHFGIALVQTACASSAKVTNGMSATQTSQKTTKKNASIT